MSSICKEDREIFEETIQELVKLFFQTYSMKLFVVIISKIFEYVCLSMSADPCYDTELKNVLAKSSLDEETQNTLLIMQTIRNNSIMHPSEITYDTINFLRITFEDKVVDELVSYFEDKTLLCKFFKYNNDMSKNILKINEAYNIHQ